MTWAWILKHSRFNIQTAKSLYGEISYSKISSRRNFLTAKFPTAKFPTARFHTAKFPATLENIPLMHRNKKTEAEPYCLRHWKSFGLLSFYWLKNLSWANSCCTSLVIKTICAAYSNTYAPSLGKTKAAIIEIR